MTVAHKPHIIATTESWLNDKIYDPEIEIRDSSLFRKFRKGRGGGALLFIRSSLRPKQKIQLKHEGTVLTVVVTSRFVVGIATLNLLCV